MKYFTYIIATTSIALMVSASGLAQVGIKNSTPKSIVDIEASNSGTPANTDGLLVPRIDAFPATSPGVDQDGMISFLSTTQGNFKKRHHYWDNALGKWIPFGGEWMDGYNQNYEHLTYVKQAFAENQKDVVILDNGRLGIGTDDPDESIEIKLPGDNDIQITSADPPNAPNFHFVTRNGTFAAPLQLNDDDVIGSVTVTGWSGSGESDILASITSLADGDHTSGNLPSKFNLSVTGVGDDSEDDNGIEMTIEASGNVGIGNEDPTGVLHIKAGGTVAESAPIKFNAGTNLTTPETGAFEYDGSHLYFTLWWDRKILLKGLTNTATLNFPDIPINSSAELTVTVPNATLGSSCNCTPMGSIENGVKWSCYVSAADTVTIRLSNIQNSAVNPASKSWKVTVIE